ncbi:hypothetical protein MUO14_23045 [Halobacillus shinanisalinarum]|uniref:Magnesium transporter MgtE intracellular domain-containing protein n=1 Tax=Halobacillus shinanisalinarum TaxID=2932258 RepID=A0ABY4GYE7_9BACI|nr:hypothetical protein [Halobacillus shinanisalinarum]UOQ93222.1 hypothetical protein MUO14_23045 [Halobacillus shinanisalinarum]
MAKKVNREQEKGSKRQWFFLVIVVPTLFALTLTLVVLTIMGVNVIEKAESYANQIPGLSSLVSTSEEKQSTRQTEQLEATLANHNAEISQLEQEVNDKQGTIEELNQQIEQLEADLDAEVNASPAAEPKEEMSSEINMVKEMAVSFEEMDEEKAAPIIENMNQDLAVQVLIEVASSERGAILGAMTPESAAEIASSIANSSAD